MSQVQCCRGGLMRRLRLKTFKLFNIYRFQLRIDRSFACSLFFDLNYWFVVGCISTKLKFLNIFCFCFLFFFYIILKIFMYMLFYLRRRFFFFFCNRIHSSYGSGAVASSSSSAKGSNTGYGFCGIDISSHCGMAVCKVGCC